MKPLTYRSPTKVNADTSRDDKPAMFAILVLIAILILGVCFGIAMWTTHPAVAEQVGGGK